MIIYCLPLTRWAFFLCTYQILDSFINENTSLASISIPGTHDTGAYVYEPLAGTAKCQKLTIAQQLDVGVRYLDIRCKHGLDRFHIHHGSACQTTGSIKDGFDNVLSACFNFLDSKPKEVIIMQINEETAGDKSLVRDTFPNTRSFEDTCLEYLNKNPTRWFWENRIPILGEVRGKIILIRRFPSTKIKGIDITEWEKHDNPSSLTINGQSYTIRIQDNYKVSDTNTKWNYFTDLLHEAKYSTPDWLYMNFPSGYKPKKFGIPDIPAVSNELNPKLSITLKRYYISLDLVSFRWTLLLRN